MSKLKDMSLEDLEAAIGSGQTVRSQQLIHVAIGLGTLLFVGVVGFLYSTTEVPPEPGDLDILNILSLVHLAVALGCWTAAFVLPGILLGSGRLETTLDKPMRLGGGRYGPGQTLHEPAEIFLALTTQAHILRIALLEGAAMFGLVICLLGTVEGQLQAHPIYWLNTLSTVVLLLVLGATIPSEERLIELFRRKREESGVTLP